MATLPLNRDYGKIDFTDRQVSQTMIFKEGDTGAYNLRAVIADNGQPVNLTNCTVTVALKKPDNTVIVDSATVTIAASGYVEYVLPNNATDQKGYLDLQLAVVTSTNNRANLPTIRIYLDETIDVDGAVAPSPDVPILVDLISQVNNILNTVMLISTYDVNNNGIVDNSERLNGEVAAYYLARVNHTGTQPASTITGLATIATTGAYTDLIGAPTTITAQQAADIVSNNAYRSVGHIPLSQRGAANGVATLNSLGEIPDSFINLGNRNVTELNDISSAGRGSIITTSEATAISNNSTYRNVGHIPLSQKAAADGVATLNSSGHIPTSQINIDTDDVSEGTNNLYYTDTRVSANTTVAGNAQDIVDLTTRLTDIETVQDTPITQNTGIEHYPNAMGRGLKELLLLGQTLRNLIDNGVNYSNWSVDAGSSASANGITLVANGGNEFAEMPINAKENTEYTMIYRVASETLTSDTALAIAGGPTIVQADIFIDNTVGVHAVTLTTRATITNNRIFFAIADTEANGNQVQFEIYGFIEGDRTSRDITSPLAFGLNSVGTSTTLPDGSNGYKMEILTTGKNLNSLTEDGGITSTGTEFTDSNLMRSGFVPIRQGETYSISVEGQQEATIRFLFDQNKTFIKQIQLPSSNEVYVAEITGFIRVYRNKVPGLNDFQIEASSTVTAYEPYTSYLLQVDSPNPLRGIGTVRDEVREVNGSGEILRRIGEITFDGDSSEGWNLSDNGLTDTYRFSISVPDSVSASQGMSNFGEFITSGTSSIDRETMQFSSGNLFLRILKTRIPSLSVANLRNYLSNNNIIVNYQLATPTTESIEPTPQLPTFEPTTIQLLNNVKPTLSGRMPTNIAGELQTLANMALINKKEIDRLENERKSQLVINSEFDARLTALEP